MKNIQFYIMSAVAFVGFLLLINVNSALADRYNLNGVFKGIGAAFMVAAAVFFVIKYKNQGGNPNRG